MDLFISKQSTVSVEVFVYDDNGQIGATDSESTVPSGKSAQKLTFQFRRPTFQDSNAIMGKAHKIVRGELEINNTVMQEEALRILLTDWDLSENNGTKVEFSQAKLSTLDPSVARAAFSGLMGKVSF